MRRGVLFWWLSSLPSFSAAGEGERGEKRFMRADEGGAGTASVWLSSGSWLLCRGGATDAPVAKERVPSSALTA